MFECKICNKQFAKKVSLEKHIGTSYGKESKKGKPVHIPLLVYFAKYDGNKRLSKKVLKKMYWQDGKSTLTMSLELGVQKITLLNTMRYYDIPFRDKKEQCKNRAKVFGVWNDGKTKFDHPSIMRYANSRMGKNNPYFTAPNFDERQRKSYEKGKQLAMVSQSRNPKSTEIRMCKILDANNVLYKRNFCIKRSDGKWRLFDFLIDGKFLLELHGNYWHGNPKMYKADDLIFVGKWKKNGILAKDIWAYDAEKQKLAESFGYPFLALWESEIIKMSDCELLKAIQHEQNTERRDI